MVFMSLYDSYKRNELLMIDGGFCQFRQRKDGQITIHAVLSNRVGAGKQMLQLLKERHPTKIVAKCPVDYSSNEWYRKMGFVLQNVEDKVNVWCLECGS